MKKIIYFILTLAPICFAQSGRLFTTQSSLEDNKTKLVIRTNIPNHQYSYAGITLPSGYTFADNSCIFQYGNTCFFAVSDSNPVTLYVNGNNSSFSAKLCLNQKANLNCEILNINFTTYVLEMGAYAGGSNGQIYSGVNNSNWELYSPNNFVNTQFKASYCANDGSYCLGGGFTGTSNANFIPVVYRKTPDNNNWSLSDTTNSSGALSYPIQFWDMTCLSGTDFCIAGGNGQSGGSQYGYVWYSYDKGSSWSIPYLAPKPHLGAYDSVIMSATSCYNSPVFGSKCVVAGRADNNLGLVEVGTVTQGTPINFTASYLYSTSIIQHNFVLVSGVYCNNNGRCLLSANLSNSSDLNVSINPLYSAIYYSNDGGSTWAPSQITTLAPEDAQVSNVSAVSCDVTGLNCIASGWYSPSLNNSPAKGLVYISHDGGITWPKTIVFPYPNQESNVNRLNAARCSQTNSTCYVTGHGGNNSLNTEFPISYLSYDGGQNWSDVSLLPLPPTQQASPSSNLFTVSLYNKVSN